MRNQLNCWFMQLKSDMVKNLSLELELDTLQSSVGQMSVLVCCTGLVHPIELVLYYFFTLMS